MATMPKFSDFNTRSMATLPPLNQENLLGTEIKLPETPHAAVKNKTTGDRFSSQKFDDSVEKEFFRDPKFKPKKKRWVTAEEFI